MKKLKNYLFYAITLVLAFSISGCQKDIQEPTIPQDERVDVEFMIEQSDFPQFKSTNNDVPQCSDLDWDYVTFKLNGIEYMSDIVTTVGSDVKLTQVVKLPSGTSYTLSEFYIWNDGVPFNDPNGDILVRAAPISGSEYEDLMVHPLNIEVEVFDFTKRQIIVDVLCYDTLFYEKFGFSWFGINEIELRRQCFFGDVCTGKLDDFVGSLYEEQSQGIQMDMPAIMQLKLYKKVSGDWGTPIRTFANDTWTTPGEGDCLEIYWADDLDVIEDFKLELYVLLPYGDGMEWTLIDVFEFQDNNGPDVGDDNVTDFTIGNCNISGTEDYVYPAWINIPNFGTYFQMKIELPFAPGTKGTYINAIFTGIGTGFAIDNDTVGVWCGDKVLNINPGQVYDVQAISSLQPLPPSFSNITVEQLSVLNYFWNNLNRWFPGINPIDFTDFSGSGFDSTDWAIIQDVIWSITDNWTVTGEALTIHNQIITETDFVPVPGDYAAILFWVNNQVQTVFIQVDP